MKRMISKVLVLIFPLVAAQDDLFLPNIPQFCPLLTCGEPLSNRVCYQHSGDSPVTRVKTYPCDGDKGQICDVSLDNEDDMVVAWVETDKQYWSFKMNDRVASDPSYSNVFMRNTLGYCRDPEAVWQKGLNAGRRCIHNHQCNTMNCEVAVEGSLGRCRGKPMGEDCGRHEECDVALACRRDASWPYKTTCKSYAKTGDQCENDYDCTPSHLCIREKETDFLRRCLPRYSADNSVTFGWDNGPLTTRRA